MQQLNYELLRQRREQLLHEAEREHLVRKLREARQGVSSLPGDHPGSLVGWIVRKILGPHRVPGETARCRAKRII